PQERDRLHQWLRGARGRAPRHRHARQSRAACAGEGKGRRATRRVTGSASVIRRTHRARSSTRTLWSRSPSWSPLGAPFNATREVVGDTLLFRRRWAIDPVGPRLQPLLQIGDFAIVAV